jgi:hypothetical protein
MKPMSIHPLRRDDADHRRDRADTPPTGRVPAEFIGLARQLRRRIVKAHPEAAMAAEQLTLPLRPREDFAPIYGRSVLRVAAARWRALPAFGRLHQVTQLAAGKLELIDLRVEPSRIEAERWDADEPALALSLRTIVIEPPAYDEKDRLIVGIGLHALARRYERGSQRTDAAVLRDLVPLALAYPEIARARGEFAIPLSGGGRWIGTVGSPTDAVAVVRTFVRD